MKSFIPIYLIILIMASGLVLTGSYQHAAAQGSASQSEDEDADQQELFNEALEYYRQLNYSEALPLLESITEIPEARLLYGNSLFALGKYPEAAEVLEEVVRLPFTDLAQEATYTLGMLHLTLRNYGEGLSRLYSLERSFNDSLREQALELAGQYNRFLTFNQRMQAIDEAATDEAALQLIRTGMEIHGPRQARELYVRAQRLRPGRETLSELRDLADAASDDNGQAAEVPAGFIYRIGVVFPQQERNDDGYDESRSLYYGLMLAAEEFNRSRNDLSVELVLMSDLPDDMENLPERENGGNSSGEAPEVRLQRLTEKLIEDYRPDILFGPLFSDDARLVAEVAREYELPVISPLANTEDLTIGNDWFFHANPTFAERGRIMAEIATQYLGHRRISVLTDRTTPGDEEARAFRRRALELGAEIPYFFSDDLQQRRFDLSSYSRYFTSNPNLLDLDDDELEVFLGKWVQSDALYMPVTGPAAATVIDLMMTQLLALRSNVQVIGSQDFGSTSINRQAASRFNILYGEVFHRDEGSEAVRNFNDDYRAAYGRTPDLFSYIGYDSGNFIASVLLKAGNPSNAREALLKHEPFNGIGQRFDFTQGQINRAIVPLKFTDNRFRIWELPEEPRYDLVRQRSAELEARAIIDDLSRRYEKEEIFEYYKVYRFEGRGVPEEFSELFPLLENLDLEEVRQMLTTPEPEDFEEVETPPDPDTGNGNR